MKTSSETFLILPSSKRRPNLTESGKNMYTLTVETKFASAHQLREYQGKCENIHGHSWRVQVVVTCRSLNRIGLAMDFTDLKRLTNEVTGPLDHVCLNDLP